MQHTRPVTKLLLAGSLVVAPFTLAACGEDTAGPEEDVSVADIQEDPGAEAGVDPGAEAGLGYDGLYDSAFYVGSSDYVGQQVTVSATVEEVFGPNSFSIASTEDASVEPLLIVGADSSDALQAGDVVQVTGSVQSGYSETIVEDELGIELADDAFADFEEQNYIVADSVSTSVPAEDE